MSRSPNLKIAPRVLTLCQEPRTTAEVEDAFPGSEAHLARYAIYNLVKRGQLRNLTKGKCGNGKPGRFIAIGRALDGESDSAHRERIGNAVPSDAAQAVASAMGLCLLSTWAGEGFQLSSQPVWVRPAVAGLKVAQGAA